MAGGLGAAGDFADDLAVEGDGVMRARWRGGAEHLEGGELAGQTSGFLCDERGFADEVAFVHGDEKTESGLKRCFVGEGP